MIVNCKIALLLFCAVIFLALAAIQVVAQSDGEEPEACSQIVQDAFVQVGQVCAGYGVGQICIGNSDVTATFGEEVNEGFFTQPGDIADLTLLQTVETSPENVNDQTWGLTVVNTQASLPTEVVDSLDNKGVIYFVLGGLDVSEATPADNIVIPLQQGVPVTTVAAADFRLAPVALDGEFSNVIGQIPSETTLNADAITPDEEWVRVVFEDQPGWVRRSIIPSSEDLSALVVIGPDNFTPMQSFDVERYSNNGDCHVTEQGVIIHGPDSLPTDVQVNGIPVRVDSTIITTPLPNNQLSFCTITGVGIVYPNDPARRTIIPPGFGAVVDLTTGNFVTPDAFEGTNIAPCVRPFTIRFWNFVSRFFPTNLTHYTPNELGITAPSGVGGGEWFIIHINVQRIDITRVMCNTGLLPANVCRVYGF